MIYNLFEQSGTFKNEEIKLGYQAVDVDILNSYNQTNFQIDLFDAIEKAYEDKSSFFDRITKDDFCFSFFPCTKFTEKIFVNSKCNNPGMKNWNNLKKLDYTINFMNDVNYYYSLFCKLYFIALKRNLKMVIENPYPNRQHYLDLFFPFERTIIDYDRSLHGDYYKKPTGYWFINFVCNEVPQFFQNIKNTKTFSIPKEYKIKELGLRGTREELRSMISPKYARWFLESFVVPNYKEKKNTNNLNTT